jgi:tRNA dimethylallyltransferase
MSHISHPVVLLMGPTAAGKTDAALELASQFPVEIVSVDSAMVYRGLDIGTGKPDAQTLERYPHHLVDILNPSETYSAGQFVRDAVARIGEIHGRGHIPLLVGGTMLYFRALTRGLADLPPADPHLRSTLNARAASEGWPALHRDLMERDPAAAARIQPNDGQRIQRALEVIALTGQPISELQRQAKPALPLGFVKSFVWSPQDRELLYKRIANRFQQMLARGLLDEVRGLFNRGDLHADLPSVRAVGYRQLWMHLAGTYAWEDAVREAVLATKHLARRQLIWLRSDTHCEWLDSGDPQIAINRLQEQVRVLCG